MGNGGRTDAGLIGEGGAPEPLDQRAEKTASHPFRREGTADDHAEGPGYPVVIQDQDEKGGGAVNRRHQRHQLRGDLRDRADAADDDEADQNRHDQPVQPGLVGEEAGCAAGRADKLAVGLVHLEHVAAAQRPADAADCEEGCQEFAQPGQAAIRQPAAEIMHRSAGNRPVFIHPPVFHAQRAFGEFRGHAEQAGEDHPEGRSRPADRDGDCHAGDVAEADRGGQRRRERLEVRDLTRCAAGLAHLAGDQPHGMAEAAQIDETQIAGEEAGAEDQPDHDQADIGPGDAHGIEHQAGHRIGIGRQHPVDRAVQRGEAHFGAASTMRCSLRMRRLRAASSSMPRSRCCTCSISRA